MPPLTTRMMAARTNYAARPGQKADRLVPVHRTLPAIVPVRETAPTRNPHSLSPEAPRVVHVRLSYACRRPKPFDLRDGRLRSDNFRIADVPGFRHRCRLALTKRSSKLFLARPETCLPFIPAECCGLQSFPLRHALEMLRYSHATSETATHVVSSRRRMPVFNLARYYPAEPVANRVASLSFI